MADEKKELKTIKKTVRLSPTIVAQIEKRARQSGVAFSETVRRAVTEGLKRSEKAKEK